MRSLESSSPSVDDGAMKIIVVVGYVIFAAVMAGIISATSGSPWTSGSFKFILIIATAGTAYYLWYGGWGDEHNPKTPQDRIQRLNETKYSPDMDRWSARQETSASEARTALATQLNQETSAVSTQIDIQAEAERKFIALNHEVRNIHEKLDMALDLQREQHAVELKKLQAEMMRVIQAAQTGLSPEGYEKLVIEEKKIELEILRQQRGIQLDLDKQRGFKQIELEAEHGLAELDSKMLDLKNLMPYHEYEVINNKLKAAFYELEAVKAMEPGELKDKELKRVQGIIQTFKKDISERKKRLL